MLYHVRATKLSRCAFHSTWCWAINSPASKKKTSEQKLELSVGFDKNKSDFCNCFKSASSDFFFFCCTSTFLLRFPFFFSIHFNRILIICSMNFHLNENSNISKSWMWSLILDNYYVCNSYKVMHIFLMRICGNSFARPFVPSFSFYVCVNN